MTEAAFTTELSESGELLVGPWRSPKRGVVDVENA